MTEPTAATPTRISRFWPFPRLYYGWAILTAGMLSSFAAVSTQGPIMSVFFRPIQDELGWSASALSVGFVLGTVFGALLSAGSGRLLDRFGARPIAIIAGLVMTACLIGLANMTEPWHFWVFFATARGSATAGAQLGTMVSVAAWFVRKRGRVVGLVGTGQRLGQAVFPIPILAITVALSWRDAWLGLAALTVLFLVIPSGVLMRRRPEDFGLLPDGERVTSQEPGALQAASDQVEETWTLAEARRTKTLWALMVAQTSIVLSVNAANLHVTASLQDKGLSFALAVTVTTIFAATSALATLPWGLLMERIHSRTLGFFIASLFLLSMVIIIVADTFWLAAAFGVVYGLALGGWTVVSRMLYANYFGRRSFGSIRGFAAPIMVTVNPLGPLFAGIVRDLTGSYDLAYAMFGGFFALGFAAFVVAKPLRKVPAATT